MTHNLTSIMYKTLFINIGNSIYTISTFYMSYNFHPFIIFFINKNFGRQSLEWVENTILTVSSSYICHFICKYIEGTKQSICSYGRNINNMNADEGLYQLRSLVYIAHCKSNGTLGTA